MVIVNLKSYRYSYEDLIHEIWWQLEKPGEEPASLLKLVEQCEQQKRQMILCLHNFDTLFNSTENDAKYDFTFCNALNFCKERPNIALLCVTQKSYTDSVICINGKTAPNSLLDLEQQTISALKEIYIFNELKRILPQKTMNYLWRENMLGDIAKRIQTNPKPYAFLVYITNKFNSGENAALPLKKQITGWEESFEKTNATVTPAKINHAQKKISFWRQHLGFAPGKAQSRWKLLLKIAIAIVSSLGALGLIKPELLKKLLELLNLWNP